MTTATRTVTAEEYWRLMMDELGDPSPEALVRALSIQCTEFDTATPQNLGGHWIARNPAKFSEITGGKPAIFLLEHATNPALQRLAANANVLHVIEDEETRAEVFHRVYVNHGPIVNTGAYQQLWEDGLIPGYLVGEAIVQRLWLCALSHEPAAREEVLAFIQAGKVQPTDVEVPKDDLSAYELIPYLSPWLALTTHQAMQVVMIGIVTFPKEMLERWIAAQLTVRDDTMLRILEQQLRAALTS